MKYEDPENVQDIIKDIFKMKTIQDIVDLLNTLYPSFIRDKLEEYSKDYPHFDINWRGMCLTLKVKKAYILIVDEFHIDEKHILLQTFCEVLTQAGFIIRKYTEFFPCAVCKSALPTEEIYTKLVTAKVKTPSEWDKKCISC